MSKPSVTSIEADSFRLNLGYQLRQSPSCAEEATQDDSEGALTNCAEEAIQETVRAIWKSVTIQVNHTRANSVAWMQEVYRVAYDRRATPIIEGEDEESLSRARTFLEKVNPEDAYELDIEWSNPDLPVRGAPGKYQRSS